MTASYCINPLQSNPVGGIGVTKLILGIIFLLMSVLNIYWIFLQKFNAKKYQSVVQSLTISMAINQNDKQIIDSKEGAGPTSLIFPVFGRFISSYEYSCEDSYSQRKC